MSEKRTSAETRIPNDEKTTEDSDAVLPQEDNDKREDFASISDTTLQDIPTEILQYILIKAVTMEVQNMKLAKSVWKEKADLVISRLETVCSQWNSVLATDFFEIELHRTLDGIAQKKFRMDRVQELYLDSSAFEIAALKDDIFLLCLRYDDDDDDDTTSEISSVNNISVYDRNNIERAKYVIELSGLFEGDIAACNVSNCVYVLKEKFESQCASVLRITKDENQKFNIQPWINDLKYPVSSITVSDDGKIVLSATPDELHLGLSLPIIVYNPNGFLHHEVVLPQNVYGCECIDSRVIRKPNGNFVLASVIKQSDSEIHIVNLTEIDPNGVIQRQYKPSLDPFNEVIFMSFVDVFGRILIHDMNRGIELFDSELNLLESTGPQSYNDDDIYFDGLHFDRERKEVLAIWPINSNGSVLRIFSFIEE